MFHGDHQARFPGTGLQKAILPSIAENQPSAVGAERECHHRRRDGQFFEKISSPCVPELDNRSWQPFLRRGGPTAVPAEDDIAGTGILQFEHLGGTVERKDQDATIRVMTASVGPASIREKFPPLMSSIRTSVARIGLVSPAGVRGATAECRPRSL